MSLGLRPFMPPSPNERAAAAEMGFRSDFPEQRICDNCEQGNACTHHIYKLLTANNRILSEADRQEFLRDNHGYHKRRRRAEYLAQKVANLDSGSD